MSHGTATSFAALAACCVLASASAAQAPGDFDVLPLVGAAPLGRLMSVSPSGDVTVGAVDGTTSKHQLASLSEWTRQVGQPAEPSVTGSFDGLVMLRSGASLRVGAASGAGAKLEVDTPFADARVAIQLQHIASLRVAPARNDDGGFKRALANPAKTKDLLFAWTADGADLKRFSVKIESVDRDTVAIDTGRGRGGSIPLSRVYGIVFGADHGSAPDPLPAPRILVQGAFGSTFNGKLSGWDGVQCRLRLAESIDLTLPCTSIAKVAVDTGKVAYLSSVEPSAVEQVPAMDRVRPWLRNRTPMGDGIQLGGIARRGGICLVPKSTLTWTLADLTRGQKFDVFEAVVGIDDRSDPKLAHAIFRVLIDGKLAFESEPMVVGQEPESIQIPLEGAVKLTLETDFGDNLDLGDHCVFADARLRQT